MSNQVRAPKDRLVWHSSPRVNKFVNVRRWGRCFKCQKFRELRASFNEDMSEVSTVCDACFDCPPMTAEDFDLLYGKAGVTGQKSAVNTNVYETGYKI